MGMSSGLGVSETRTRRRWVGTAWDNGQTSGRPSFPVVSKFSDITRRTSSQFAKVKRYWTISFERPDILTVIVRMSGLLRHSVQMR